VNKKWTLIFALLFALIAFAEGSASYYQVSPEKCVGCRKCVIHCPVKAISMEEGKAVIDPSKCISCGVCARICPANAIDPVMAKPDTQTAPDDCLETFSDSLQTPFFIPERCISCASCAKVCPEIAIEMIDGKPVIDPEKCTLCGTCVKICPVGALFFPEEKDS